MSLRIFLVAQSSRSWRDINAFNRHVCWWWWLCCDKSFFRNKDLSALMTKSQWYIQSKSHIGTPVVFWDTFCLNPPPRVTGLKHFSAICVCVYVRARIPTPWKGTFHGFQECLRRI